MGDRKLQQLRILVMYPFSTPCVDLVKWVQDMVRDHGFQPVDPPLQIRECKEFRDLAKSVVGMIALCIPFDSHRPRQSSAWIHNWIGGMAVQTEPGVPILVIKTKQIDMGGLGKLDEYRCPVEYPWRHAELAEQEKAWTRIQPYLEAYFDRVRQTLVSKIMQVTVVLIDIVAFTSYEFRSEQLSIADEAKYRLKQMVEPYQPRILYTSDGGDGGYFVFRMDVAAIHVLQFAQRVLAAFSQKTDSEEDLGIKVRIAIDCGGVGQGTSVVDWRRSTLIRPPMNTCSRIIGYADANEIVTTERFYQLLTGERYGGCFSEPEVVTGKHAQQFAMRRYKCLE